MLPVATHYGMFTVDEDHAAARVGNQQGTMGFTVAGPGAFCGSGPPDVSQDNEPLLGRIDPQRSPSGYAAAAPSPSPCASSSSAFSTPPATPWLGSSKASKSRDLTPAATKPP